MYVFSLPNTESRPIRDTCTYGWPDVYRLSKGYFNAATRLPTQTQSDLSSQSDPRLLSMTDLSTMYLGVHTHVMGKGGVGLPTNGSSGRANFLHHPVDLLEG